MKLLMLLIICCTMLVVYTLSQSIVYLNLNYSYQWCSRTAL